MAVAFDAASTGVGTSTFSWSHTPVGTPRGVIVFVVQSGAVDEITSVTHGGVSMTEADGSPLIKLTGESCVVYVYFLGSGISGGAQTVEVVAGIGTLNKRAIAVTLTASGNTAGQDTTTISSDALENPSGTLSLGNVSSFCCEALFSGQDAVTGITPSAGWTSRDEYQFTTLDQTAACYTYDTVGVSDVTMGWTQTSEDAVSIGIAIKDLSSALVSMMALLGVGK